MTTPDDITLMRPDELLDAMHEETDPERWRELEAALDKLEALVVAKARPEREKGWISVT